MSFPLPQELLLEIVALLEDDADSLRDLALASSVFRSPCQTALFSHISLSFNPTSPNPDHVPSRALANIYRRSPELLACAKSVTVRDWSGWTQEPPPFPPSFAEVITQLANQDLQKVNIVWGERWNPPMSDALETLIRCPTLLSLHMYHLPMQLLDSIESPYLEELSMDFMSKLATEGAADESQTTPSSKPQPYRLRSLALDSGIHELNFAQKLNLGYLKSLRLKDNGDPWAPTVYAGTVIASCASTLEVLRFSNETVRWSPERFIGPETIGRLQQLRELIIDCDSCVTGAGGRINTYLWLPDFLDHLPTPCFINKLHLQSRFWQLTDVDGEVEFWNSVDARLASHDRFPKLTSVDVVIDLDPPEGELSKEELENFFETHSWDIRHKFFPKLRSEGRLEGPKSSDMPE
ncbi:hypothetical protein BKA70DRAFT_1431892 [Coprinopsis sp. MPI-PUGE-AT-0042]|nr:hypothetical protein BKA70DRAFT_1431892 [Coprinopsis sp. MPI-PUGE-AT-0042]